MERSESAPTSVLELFSSFDAALVDDSRGVLSLILLKKFKNESGKITLAVFHIAEVGKSIGPLSAHLNGLTRNWLKTKRLVLNEKGEPWNYGRFNSANHPKNTDAHAERITPATGVTIQNGGQDVNQDGEVGEREVPTDIVECRTQGEEQARFSVGRPYSDAIRFSISPSAQREYDEVVNRYTNLDGTKKPGWLKAPNSKQTKLTERQLIQVCPPVVQGVVRRLGDGVETRRKGRP